jgi:hypothetical protein
MCARCYAVSAGCNKCAVCLCRHPCRKLEDVLTEKQRQLLTLIRQAKEQTDARDTAAAAAAAAATEDDSGINQSSRGLKRSRSVSWESPSMHTSSDASGVEQQVWQYGGSIYLTESDVEGGSAVAADGTSGIGLVCGSKSSSNSDAVTAKAVHPQQS